jgi:hypothetical protein
MLDRLRGVVINPINNNPFEEIRGYVDDRHRLKLEGDLAWVLIHLMQAGLMRRPPQRNSLVRHPSEPYADLHEARRKLGMEMALEPAHRCARAMLPLLTVQDVRPESIGRLFGDFVISESVIGRCWLRNWIDVEAERIERGDVFAT